MRASLAVHQQEWKTAWAMVCRAVQLRRLSQRPVVEGPRAAAPVDCPPCRCPPWEAGLRAQHAQREALLTAVAPCQTAWHHQLAEAALCQK